MLKISKNQAKNSKNSLKNKKFRQFVTELTVNGDKF